MGRYDADLRREIGKRIASAIISASGHRQPARIGWAVTAAPEFVSDRRREDPDQVTDPEVFVIRVDGEDGKPIAALADFAAHGTCLGPDNMLVSADYPGYFQRRLESRIGGGAVAMFANGAQGDQAPHSPNGKGGYAAAEDVGVGLADRAFETWRTIRTERTVAVNDLD
jgi:neutral ceramidase